MSGVTRAGIAGALVVTAAVLLVFGYTGEATPASVSAAQLATPLWSARRVPQPIADGVGSQRLQRALDQTYGGDGTCFLVESSGTVLASHGVDTPLIGASTQKLLVAAAVLSAIGPDSVF